MDTAVAQPTSCGYISEIVDALNHPQVVSRLIQFPRNTQQARACIARYVYPTFVSKSVIIKIQF